MSDDRRIDWSTAEVRNGTLVVALRGEDEEGWATRFELVLRRLQSHDRWTISLKESSVEVTGVASGAEDDIRHLLESIVQQVAADLRPPEEDSKDDSSLDRELSEHFRSFADEPED